MIEMVYKGNGDGKNGDRLKLPKNVRQIGEAGKGKRVYLEDYAVTYLHQVEAAVLLGETWEQDEVRYIFIHGAIRVEDPAFGEEAWEDIYREAKQYFENSEILGWAMQVQEQPLALSRELNDLYKTHFDREDAVLILYEPSEKEDSVFVEENGSLRQQNGYYIYYDKNKSMQDYMVFRNEGKSVERETEVTDNAIKSFRKIAEEKREKREKQERKENPERSEKQAVSQAVKEKGGAKAAQPKTVKFLYAASTFLVLTILIIGVTMVNNYDKMKNMELALSDMAKSTEASAKASSKGTASTDKKDSAKKETESMTETAGDKAEGESETAAESGQGLSGNAQKGSEGEKNAQDPKAGAASDGQNPTDPQSAAAGTEAQAAGQDQSQAQTEIPTAAPGTAGDGQAVGGQAVGGTQGQSPDVSAQAASQGAQAAAEHTNQAAYIVKAGDTLADICRMYYGTTDRLDEICTLNGISDPNTILLGQKILLP